MSDLISRSDALEVIEKLMDIHFDRKVVLAKVFNQIKDLPSAQPEREYTMEEFMFGQDMGDPEDGSL